PDAEQCGRFLLPGERPAASPPSHIGFNNEVDQAHPLFAPGCQSDTPPIRGGVATPACASPGSLTDSGASVSGSGSLASTMRTMATVRPAPGLASSATRRRQPCFSQYFTSDGKAWT